MRLQPRSFCSSKIEEAQKLAVPTIGEREFLATTGHRLINRRHRHHHRHGGDDAFYDVSCIFCISSSYVSDGCHNRRNHIRSHVRFPHRFSEFRTTRNSEQPSRLQISTVSF